MNRVLAAINAYFRAFLPKNYLYRLIWIGCITMSIPIVLAGSAYYHFSMKKLTAQFQENNQSSLNLLEDRVENVLTAMEHESLQLASSPLLRNSLGREDYAVDYFQQLAILELFQLHKNTNNLIQEIIFYDKRSQLALSSAYGLVRIDEYYQRGDILEGMGRTEPAGWVYLPEASADGYITYLRQLPVMSTDQPEGAILIHVREESLRALLKSYSLNLDNQTLAVLDSHNRIILHTDGSAMVGKAAGDDPTLRTVLAREERASRYTLRQEEGNLLLAYGRTAYGRTYISLVPEQEMIAQLSWIRALIVFSALIFLLIGVLLTFFSSRLAYNPIQKLLQYGEHLRKTGAVEPPKGNEIDYIRSCLSYLNEQAQSLNQYVQNMQPDLLHRHLQKLLTASAPVSRASLEAESRKYDFPTEGQFIVLITKVENLQKEKRFMPNEGAVIVFAVKNVMNELLARFPGMQGYVTDKDDREAVAILHFADDVPMAELRRTVRQYAEEARDAMDRYLSFAVSTGIGRPARLEGLAGSYKDAQSALQYRLFHDADTILFYDDMIRIERHPVFMYPTEIEQSIVEFLWSGDLPQADEALQQFSKRVRTAESYNIIFQCYQVLLSSIIQSLEEKGPGVLELLGNNLFDQLKENQTSREVHDWFIGVLFPLYQQVSHEIRTKSARLMIQRVCNHITNHPDGTHSLSECAELVGVSPSYLSRLFKKETGISFIEYVMEFKVEKAKQLLKDTDHSVTEIAEIVGYSERNLNRAFQRFVQMSPKQYRMANR